MGKLALVTKVGPTDQGVQIPEGAYQGKGNVSILHNKGREDISIDAFTTALKKLKLEPTERMMDLLVIAASMYSADTRISRAGFAEDSWTRMIDLYVPVSDSDFWNEQASLLQKIFRFLTGDIWTIIFRKRSDSDLTLSPKGRLRKYGMPYQTDIVCLFSGGMDSFIGAVNFLEEGIRPLLVGHAKSNDVSRYQRICGDALDTHYGDLSPARVYAFIRTPKNDLFGNTENSERGRSFLFLTLGAICAASLSESSKLVVPENGMISLNIPLTPLRVGSHSTRTTHPHYFSMMQALFDKIESGVTIVNPFQFKTKGEMLKECLNQKLVVDTETMSCSHPFIWRSKINAHCGYCVPCIIRQAAFQAAGYQDKFVYKYDIFDKSGVDVKSTKGADVLAFKYMIEKVKQNPVYLYATIRNTGPLGNNVTDFVSVYKRALDEVDSLINNVKLV